MDNHKVQAVLNWPKPMTVKEMQRFLGFVNFDRRFIRDFSSIAAPLTSMTKRRGICLFWSPAADQAFGHLKECFSTAPILHHPDPKRKFVVEIDASSTVVGAVLSQRHWQSTQAFPLWLLLTQAKSSRTELWCGNPWATSNEGSLWGVATMAWVIQISLLGSHWPSQPGIPTACERRLIHRWARWALFFTRFQFTVTYRPGSKNTKADALSRQFESTLQLLSPDTILPTTLIVAPV